MNQAVITVNTAHQYKYLVHVDLWSGVWYSTYSYPRLS